MEIITFATAALVWVVLIRVISGATKKKIIEKLKRARLDMAAAGAAPEVLKIIDDLLADLQSGPVALAK